jgi:uncharacterized membrane protein YbhN (UPF0104 family)
MSDEVRAHDRRRDEDYKPWSREAVVELEREALEDEEMPRVHISRKMLALGVLFVLSVVAFFIFVLPQINGLEDTWTRIEDGDPWWLGAAAAFVIASFGGYVIQFVGVFGPGSPRELTAWEAYQVTMAALAATRLFAAAGAGGLALQAWAMRRSGMSRKMVADRTITFIAVQYWMYAAALIVFGFGLRLGIFSGEAPFGVTVVPAIFGVVALTLGGLIALTPVDLQRRLQAWHEQGKGGRLSRAFGKFASVPATASAGIRGAIAHTRHPDRALAGAAAYWATQIGVLWASFHAFGAPPPLAVLVMIYFVGMLGNLLPLPGGVGGVDGGMIGACLAFGVPSSLALVSVLTYRAFAFWLPTVPGIIAYFQLRRTVSRWKAEPVAEPA